MKRLETDAISWSRDAAGEWLCIKCSHPQRVLEGIEPGKLYDVEIKQHRGRRSLDANGYFWVLADKLAEKLSTSEAPVKKDDVYRRLIRDVPGASTTVCIQDEAVSQLRNGWSVRGLGWLSETMPSKIPGCTNVVLHYGSSVFDSAQMSRLIALVVDECKEQGIETLTPEQITSLEGIK